MRHFLTGSAPVSVVRLHPFSFPCQLVTIRTVESWAR